MDKDTSLSSSIESELYFLIARFLSAGPCQRTSRVLLEELEEFKLLQTRVDWQGNEHFRTYGNLVHLNRHIRGDHLLRVVERICPLLDKEIQPSVPGVRSLLGAGSLSVLRTHEDLNRPKWGLAQHMMRQNGVAKHPPSNLAPPNLAQVLPAYQMTGVVRPHSAVPSSLYSKVNMYGRKLGHLDAVYCLLFDRTGNYMFTGADDTLVKIWSRRDLRLVATLRGHSAEITDMALSYENTLLASVSLDKSVRVWCLRTKAQRAVLHAHTSMITSVQFCPKICGDHRYIVTTGNDGCVCFWLYDILTNDFNPKPIKFVERSRAGAQMLCSSFSPGGAFLATGNSDHVIRVYFLHKLAPEKICELEAHSDKVDSICYANHHNSFISGSNDGTARIWRFDKQEWRATLLNMNTQMKSSHGRKVSGEETVRVTMVSWTMDDHQVMTAASDLTIKIWNANTGCLVRVLEGHEDEVFVLEASPIDNRILVSAGHDGRIFIWDIHSGNKVKKFFNLIEGQGHGAVFDCKFSPDGQYLAATDSHGHLLMMGIGTNELCKKTPQQLFFHTDYRPLIRDAKGFVLDEQTQCPPHLMPPPFLVDIDGIPYPPSLQRLVPGREHMKDASLVPHMAVNEAGDNEIVGDGLIQDAEPATDNNSDTETDEPGPTQQPASISGRERESRPSIDVMIEQLQRRQDQRMGVPEAGGSGQPLSPPPPGMMSSPPLTPRSAGHSRVGMRRSGEIEGVRQARPDVGPVNQDVGSNRSRLTVQPMKDNDLKMSEELRTGYSEEEVRVFLAERKKKLPSPNELTSASIANKNKRPGRKPGGNAQNSEDGPENVETARNRLTTRALYDTEEEEDEGGGSDVDMWQSEDNSSDDYSDWVGDQGSSNLEPPKRRSQRKRKRRVISSSLGEEDSDKEEEEVDVESQEDRLEGDEEEEDGVKENLSGDSGDEEREREPAASSSKGGNVKKSPAKKRSPKKKTQQKQAEEIQRTKEMDEKMKPPEWITTVIPRKAPFVPQMGDEVVYFRQGHEQYLHAVKRKEVYEVDLEKNQPWHKIPNLRAHELVKIVGIKWLIQPIRLCCLKMSFMDAESGKLTGKTFTIKYHDMPDVIDFIVLKQHFDISVQRGWKQGSRFRSIIDDQWWLGVIKSKQPLSADFTDSLYQCFNVKWDNGEFEKLSPWDMEPIDPKRKPSVVGGGIDVTPAEYKALLYVPKRTEWPSCGREDESLRLVRGISQLMEHSFAEPFSTPVDLQMFPTYAYFVSFPVDLTTIKTRLENGYYRRITALQWDVRKIHSNAIVFNQVGSKIVQMANDVTETLLKFIKDHDCQDPLPLLTELAHAETKKHESSDDETGSRKTKSGGSQRRKKAINPNQWLEQSESLLAMLFECADSIPFRLPVSLQAYPDYEEIVTKPMDLTTVHTKLATGFYKSPFDMCKDIRLVFSNSKLYNTNKRSRIYSMTLRLSALFEDQIGQVIRDYKSSIRAYGRRQHCSRGQQQSSSQMSSSWSSVTDESLMGPQPSTSAPSSSSQAALNGLSSTPARQPPCRSKMRPATTRPFYQPQQQDDDDSDATILDGEDVAGNQYNNDTDTEICDDGVAIHNGHLPGLMESPDDEDDDDDDDDDKPNRKSSDRDYKPSSHWPKGLSRNSGKNGKSSRGKGKALKRGKPKTSSKGGKKSIFCVSDVDDNLDDEDEIIIPPPLKFGKSKNGMVHSFEMPGSSDEELNNLDIKEKSIVSRKSSRRRKTCLKLADSDSVSPKDNVRIHRKARNAQRSVSISVCGDDEGECIEGNENRLVSKRSSGRVGAKVSYYQDSDWDESDSPKKNRKSDGKSKKPVRNVSVAKKGSSEDQSDDSEDDSDDTEDIVHSSSYNSESFSGKTVPKQKRNTAKRKLSSSEEEHSEDSEDDFDHSASHRKKACRILSPSKNSNSHSVKRKKSINLTSRSEESSSRDSNRRTRNRGQQRVTYMEDSEEDNSLARQASSDSDTELEDYSASHAASVSSRGRLRKMTTRARESLKAF